MTKIHVNYESPFVQLQVRANTVFILGQRGRVSTRLQCTTLFQKLHVYLRTDLQAEIVQPLKKDQPST